MVVDAPVAARTIGTLSQLNAKSPMVDEALVQPQTRTIAPIFKAVPRQEPVIQMPMPMPEPTTMIAPQEEVFMDAFSQAGMKPEAEMLRSSRVYEKVHQFMNVSALLCILFGVAVQRNKRIDLATMFIPEKHLRPAFETLCRQSLILMAFCGAIILTMWNFEFIVSATSVHLASECIILIVLCWLAQGALLLR